MTMKRREFLLGSAAAVCGPLGANAQHARKIPGIGILDFFPSPSDFVKPFREGMAALGYVDGNNIYVEYHSAEQRSDRAAELAAEYVRREFDIIVAVATPAAHAAKNATATIPIVIMVADPLATGLVESLARPGGNITGVSSNSPELVLRFSVPPTIQTPVRSCRQLKRLQPPLGYVSKRYS
jgi:putative ABC transport system substrate-binding protein